MGTRGGAMVASGDDPEDEALDPELIHDLGLYELHDESRDGDPLDLLRADVRAHCAIGERALPECAHKKRLLAHLVSLRFAAERRAALCVFDRRRRDARDEKKPGPASMASDAKTTSKTEKRKPNDLVRDSFGETDRVEWHLTASASRTDNGKDDRSVLGRARRRRRDEKKTRFVLAKK